MNRAPRPVAGLSLAPIAFLIAVITGCESPNWRNSAIARLDGRLQRDARRADVLGLSPTASFSKGFGRQLDLAAALRDATPSDHPDDEADLDLDERWFGRVEERHEGYLREVHEVEARSLRFEPFEDSRMWLVFVDETVKFYNEQGRQYEHGVNFYASNRSTLRLWDRFLVTAQPEFSVVENGAPPEDSDTAVKLRFQELTASARIGPVELTAGRTPLWWGPGRHGALLMSTNARPLDLVKVGTAGPQLLPSFLRHLGLVQFEVFASRLESARAVDEPYLAGMRLSSRLFPFLELGASRTAQFGGGDRSVTGETIWEVITASTENDDDDPGNQIASLDARVIVPWKAQPFEIYGEYGGEDEAGGFFSREAFLAGFYLPRIGPSHFAELTVEMTDTTTEGQRVWYTNGNFPDGYTYHEKIIGHHVGTDGRDIFAELRLHPREDVDVVLSYDYEEHLRKDPVEERLHQFRVGAEARLWGRFWVSAFLGLDRWNNFRQERGLAERGHVVGVGLRLEL